MKRLLIIGAMLGAIAASAFAHANLNRSDPKDGAVLAHSPNELRMWFSEPIKVGLSTIEVRDARHGLVDGSDLHADAKDPALVHLSLAPKLPAGVYKVTWNAVAQDMHVTKGALSFRVTR
jgi:methionine-rich copper-binding protein CopC